MISVGIIGIRGIVGQTVKRCLQNMKDIEIKEFCRDTAPENVDIAILCTDNPISKKMAEVYKEKAKFIIDMSSEFRLTEGVPLVIPEINADTIKDNTPLIASPNCTTTALVMALAALKPEYTLEEVFFCSYQAISGGGKALLAEAEKPESIYHKNCVPQIGSILDNGFSSEEMKSIYETRKILSLPDIKVYPHTVRVFVKNTHSLGVTLRAKEDFDIEKVKKLFNSFRGLVYSDKIITPKDGHDKNETFVCRLRKDLENPKIIHFFLVMDNTLKGAALNGAQIVDYLVENKMVA
jgi:aspartate-semialdehyde dehydrogenase